MAKRAPKPTPNFEIAALIAADQRRHEQFLEGVPRQKRTGHRFGSSGPLPGADVTDSTADVMLAAIVCTGPSRLRNCGRNARSEELRQAARRSYRWCSPPTSENATTRPSAGVCTRRGVGASFSRERCVRAL